MTPSPTSKNANDIIEVRFLREETLATSTKGFLLDAGGKDISFSPGQFMNLYLDNPAETEKPDSRTFSIASDAYANDTLYFATRMSGSDFKNRMDKLKAGDPVYLKGPMGRFTLSSPEKLERPVVMLAGGIGITPFRSMLLSATHAQEVAQPITLLYANRDEKSTAFLDQLLQLQGGHDWFQMQLCYSEKEEPHQDECTGFIDSEVIEDNVEQPHAVDYYIAGPPAMVSGLQSVLQGMKIPSGHIHAEKFAGYE